MRWTITFALLACVTVAVASCKNHRVASRSTIRPQVLSDSHRRADRAADVHTITLPRFQPDLPPGPGRQAFAVACISCHSTRYITTQPPMTAVKWEESVRKMIKTYGAPITEDQVPQIVQYIMASKESGASLAWNSLAVINLAPVTVLSPQSDPQAREKDRSRGRELFVQICANCHGQHGAGDSRAAVDQLPPANDLTAVRYSDEVVSAALYRGVPGTAMPAFPTLSRDDLRALATYTQQLGVAAEPAQPRANDEAKSLFATNCANCHGADGSGNGIAAPPLARPPTNFRLQQPSPAAAMKIITDGVPGTAMPAWKAKLSDPQRQRLAEHVRSFYATR